MSLTAGDKLGPYQVLALLGAGGMGEVYRAHDARLGRDVAIKVVREELSSGGWERFEREARAASALSHPHICSVFDVGESGGRRFLVMELLEGKTLREFISGQALEPVLAAALAAQIADALEAAHAKGIIHRDIKAGNIMVLGQRHVKVLDFGLAKYVAAGSETLTLDSVTAPGTVVGTPHYMAPELLQGKAADARSDIWALGVVLYEMLTGGLPFHGSTPFDVSSAILNQPVPQLPSRVPARWRHVVDRCLAKDPVQRYQNASELRLELEAHHAASTGTTRRTWVWIAAGGSAASVAALVWQRSRPQAKGRLTSSGGPASSNREANEAFELAMNQLRVQNDIPRAQEALGRAIELDPHFAEAIRYHAFNYAIQILNGYTNDTSLLYKAEQELRQAEQEDPGLPSIQTAKAAVYLMQGRTDLVPAKQLDQIRLADPSNREAVFWSGLMLWLSGANNEFKKRLGETLERDPLFGAGRMFLGEVLRTEGDIRGSIREQLKVLEQAPMNISSTYFLTLAYRDSNELGKARTLLEERRSAFANNYLWRLSWALLLAHEGSRDEALRTIDEETLKFAAAVFVVTLTTAELYLALGEPSKAIEWLDKAIRNGDQRVEWFQTNPRLAGIRQDPRFAQIVDAVRYKRGR